MKLQAIFLRLFALTGTIALTTLLAAAPAAHAVVEFSNFGSNYGNQVGGTIITGTYSAFGGYGSLADDFTATASGTVSSVTVAVLNFNQPTAFNAVLYPNNPATNAPLAAGAIQLGSATPATIGSGIVTIPVTLSTSGLAIGQTYWLGLTPASTTTALCWSTADNTASSQGDYTRDGVNFVNNGNAQSFEVDATAGTTATVPDTGATWAMSLGSVGLLAATHRLFGTRRA